MSKAKEFIGMLSEKADSKEVSYLLKELKGTKIGKIGWESRDGGTFVVWEQGNDGDSPDMDFSGIDKDTAKAVANKLKMKLN